MATQSSDPIALAIKAALAVNAQKLTPHLPANLRDTKISFPDCTPQEGRVFVNNKHYVLIATRTEVIATNDAEAMRRITIGDIAVYLWLTCRNDMSNTRNRKGVCELVRYVMLKTHVSAKCTHVY